MIPQHLDMRILITTQKVDMDDSNLSFFHAWIAEFARHYEQVTVICLELGRIELPSNVQVYSLGKERGNYRVARLFNFYKYLISLWSKYERVFVHMNPEYVLLGAPLWRMGGKHVSLWYTHKHVDSKLRLAEKLINIIFSASPESFRLASHKLRVVGHGIDVNKFNPNDTKWEERGGILSVSRISRAKNIELIATATDSLDVPVTIVGEPITKQDGDYYDSLLAKNYGNIKFAGPKAHSALGPYYKRAKVFINLSDTGSIDKAVLEAMASGCLPLVSNEAFRSVLNSKYLVSKDRQEIETKAKSLLASPPDLELVKYVRDNHGLARLIKLIVEMLA